MKPNSHFMAHCDTLRWLNRSAACRNSTYIIDNSKTTPSNRKKIDISRTFYLDGNDLKSATVPHAV